MNDFKPVTEMTIPELEAELSNTSIYVSRCQELILRIEKLKNIVWVHTTPTAPGHYVVHLDEY